MVREVGLEPTRRKAQVPKTCVSAVSPLPREIPKYVLEREKISYRLAIIKIRTIKGPN
jgi:hypothetical protein